MQHLQSPDPLRPQIAVRELIAMVGCLMALNALSIDILLPALAEIGHALGAPGNDRQLVITSYVFGFGLAQLGFGPLSDAMGRRKTLLIALVAYLAATVLCLVSQGLWALVAARALQGVAAAATRVIAVAIVRDLVSGRRMAEIMSFAMTVFTVAPILAPSIGQLILFGGDWRVIFIFLFVMASALALWMMTRLPETLHPEKRIELRLGSAMKNYALAASNRITLGYLTASCFIMGALFAFIATSEQVLAELYELGAMFPIAFAVIALGLAGANIVNAKIVRRLGMRRISHSALIAYLLVNGANLTLAFFGKPPFLAYFLLLMTALMLFSMIGANFSALAMEPAGDRAGTTAALYGSSTAMAGAVLGSVIGQGYDGTVLPITLGFTVLGAIAFLIVLWTEKGKLFGVGEANEPDA
ncbi:MAG: multidrug transporter [Oceanicaulis sp.]|uniref:multidrug effflux MFS transporter n=2 Tax=unclassified Oceanicaulis TaxID=2632123 RepID=UPI000C3BB82F|nr:multidrug effflux MFS transporter [Oceanicaulis sp.]MBC37656.1 multidrug transporter [Oceanicaulis sp.]HBU63518.1 multidrug transporter [Oceanicaulis sp.]